VTRSNSCRIGYDCRSGYGSRVYVSVFIRADDTGWMVCGRTRISFRRGISNQPSNYGTLISNTCNDLLSNILSFRISRCLRLTGGGWEEAMSHDDFIQSLEQCARNDSKHCEVPLTVDEEFMNLFGQQKAQAAALVLNALQTAVIHEVAFGEHRITLTHFQQICKALGSNSAVKKDGMDPTRRGRYKPVINV
jgi:hypothetical protein